MATDVSICSNGLFMIGADEINSFEDETREARICAALYPTTRDELLQSHPWSFTFQQIVLARTVDTPLEDYKYEYQIPPGTLRIVRKNELRNDYRIYQDKLFSDAPAVTIIRQVDPGEASYPAHFVRLLEYGMAEVLGASISQDETITRLFANRKNEQMRKSRGIDSQNSPNRKFDASQLRLTAVRVDG